MFRIVSRRLATPLVLSVAIAGAVALGSSRANPGTTRASRGSAVEIDKVSPPCHPNLQAQRDIASV